MTDRKRYIWAKLSDEEHEALCMIGTKTGRPLHELITEYINEGLIGACRKDNSAQAQLFVAVQEATKKDSMRTQLEYLAAVALRDEDDDAIKKVERLCAEMDIDSEEVFESAQKLGAFGTRVLSSANSSSKTQETILFVASAVKNGPVPAGAVMQAALEQGLSRTTVNQVKRILGIESVPKVGGGFLWRMPHSNDA